MEFFPVIYQKLYNTPSSEHLRLAASDTAFIILTAKRSWQKAEVIIDKYLFEVNSKGT